MAKRNNRKIGTILGLAALLLVLVLMVPIIINYDTLFGSSSVPDNNQNQGVNDTVGDGEVSDDTDDENEVVEPVLKVYYGNVELVSGEPVQSTNSNTVLTIDCKEEYEASFVALPKHNSWLYTIDDIWFGFKANVDCLNPTISNGQASIQFPYDIMEWVLLQHQGVNKEQVSLPTGVEHDVPYVGLEVIVGEESYLYPIKFNLNGVWTKVDLDKDEIVFCD